MFDVLVALLVFVVVFELLLVVVFVVPVDVVVLVFVVLVVLVVFDVVWSTRKVASDKLSIVSLKCLLEAYYCICCVCIESGGRF